MHRLQHFVGHGGGPRDGQKFPARANGHLLVFLLGKYAESKRMRFGRDNIRSELSLRAQRSNPEPQKDQIALIAPLAIAARRYFPTAFVIARQI